MARPSIPTPPRSRRNGGPKVYGTAWSYDGLSDLPSPYRTKWPYGYVTEQIRQQMMVHPKVYQSINNLKAAVIGDGGRVIPNAPPSHPQFAVKREIAEFAAWCLRHMRGSWHASARQLLDGVHECHKAAPVMLREQDAGQYRGYWVLDTLNVLPNSSFRFLRDSAGNVVKLKVKDGGEWTEYDRENFAIFTFRPIDGSIWGTTVCSPAYEPFYRDVQADPLEMAMLTQYGFPKEIYKAPGLDAQGNPPATYPVYEADGVTPVIDTRTGQQAVDTVEKRLADAVEQSEAGCQLVVPALTEHVLVQAQNGGEVFRAMREANARLIAAAILGTHQLTEAERQKSTDNAASAEGTVGLGVTDGKRALEEMVENDIFRALVVYNYGPAALDHLPIFDLGSGQNGRMISLMNAISGLVNSSAYDTDQWWYTCVETGLPLPYPGLDRVVERQTAPTPHPAGGNPGNTN